ncbi:glycosyltransferase family 4 protein [Winogradskyella forsetii]|uniref:glycosyltransferase family 4 protein n=1 Tax=Winogradskyella forsetii TaxID=2686077 RepID=UPI0015BAC8FB|nr:MraY family glycosyltransferase [Winogradskyella forsetii]
MDNLLLFALLSFFVSFILVSFLIPKISWVVKSRDLIDHPDQRSSHKSSTPTMAGVSFFLVLIFMLNVINAWDTDEIGINLIAAAALMFAIGLKDDLVVSTPRAKVIGEIMAILIIVFCNCLQVNSLQGFLGIQEVSTLLSTGIIVLMILTIVNAYNMIDGIDGLASGIGIVIFGVYGFLFYVAGEYFYFLLCLGLIGILLAYLRYNLSLTKKIFMGDTGSLIIGFCIGFLSLKFLAMDTSQMSEYTYKNENKFIIIAAVFFIPLLDTLRVIGVRLINKKSPFKPDNNHIHHILINLGLTHFKASMFLCLLNLLIAITLIILSTNFGSYIMLGFLIIYFGFFIGFFHLLRMNFEKKITFSM